MGHHHQSVGQLRDRPTVTASQKILEREREEGERLNSNRQIAGGRVNYHFVAEKTRLRWKV